MSVSLRRAVFVALAATSLAACQYLSGVAGLVVDADDGAADAADEASEAAATDASSGTAEASNPTADAASDATHAADAGADADAADAGSDVDAAPITHEVTIQILQPEVDYLVDFGELLSVKVGQTIACSGTSQCVGTLKVNVPPGPTDVTVTRSTGSDSHFTAPDSCKKNFGSTPCSITVAGPVTVQITAIAHNYVFVTAQSFSGSLGGLTQAHKKCEAAALTAGLPGTYVAWLSATGSNARDPLLSANARGFVRLDGRPFADSMAQLQVGKIFYPIKLDETGAPVPDNDIVFTGTIGSGAIGGQIYTCNGWVSGLSGDLAGAGYAHAGTGMWTNMSSLASCSGPAHLYCFRKDLNGPLNRRPPPATSRVAFLSTPVLPTGGRAALDQLCQTEATNSLLPGTYKAWVATSTATPHSPFNPSLAKGGWYRPDGLPVFPDPGVLATADTVVPEGPMTQHADATYWTDWASSDPAVWTGMDFDTKSMAGTGFTCGDWTTATAAAYGGYGQPAFTTRKATKFGVVMQQCNVAQSVYCLQQ